jgi:hypothetical protein
MNGGNACRGGGRGVEGVVLGHDTNEARAICLGDRGRALCCELGCTGRESEGHENRTRTVDHGDLIGDADWEEVGTLAWGFP